MIKPILGIAVLIAVSLSACVSPTPYAPTNNGEGYSEQKLEDNRYRVWFSGNAATPKETVEDYLLYRAAEITQQSGHDWFRVVRRDIQADTQYRTSGSAYPRLGFGPFPYGYRDRYRPIGPVYYDAVSRPVTRYVAYAVIAVYEGERPAEDEQAYDATKVIEALGATIVRRDAITE